MADLGDPDDGCALSHGRPRRSATVRFAGTAEAGGAGSGGIVIVHEFM
jgi:hypothetical protein